MHILFVSNLFPSSVEPTRATYNLNLMRGLREAGHTVRVIAPVAWVPLLDGRVRQRQCPAAHESVDGFQVDHPRYLYTPGFCIHWHHLFYRRAVAALIAGYVRDHEVDHLLLGFAYPDACAVAPLCQSLRVPYAVRLNGSDFRVRMAQPKFAPLIRALLATAPAVVCPGQALAAELVAAGFAPASIHPFRNGIDADLFHFQPAPREKRVLFVGNLVDIKCPLRLLTAFAELARHDAEVVLELVGSGPLAKRLAARAAELAVETRVRFLGSLPPSEVATRLRQAACLCLPSRSEGMPNVVLEALACGTPVVATAVGEVPFLIVDGANGFAVDASGSEPEIVGLLANRLATTLTRSWDHRQIAGTVAGFTWRAAAEVVANAFFRA